MLDWNYIESTVLDHFTEGLRQTQQSPRYHAEGDVYVHTMMVVEALKGLSEYQELNELQRHILCVAAMLYDIGKIPTTVFEMGDWHTPHHAPTGSRMARELLWKEYGLCGHKELMELREAICLLIRSATIRFPLWQSSKRMLASGYIAWRQMVYWFLISPSKCSVFFVKPTCLADNVSTNRRCLKR